MRALSNLLRPGDGTPAINRPAGPLDVHPALALVLGTADGPAESAQVIEFLDFAVRRGIEIGHLWVADRGGQIVWAVLPIVNPGKTMLLFAPGAATIDASAGPLLDAVCEHFGAAGVELGQVLLNSKDRALRELYAGRGFREMAELVYLSVQLRRPAPPPALPQGFSWRTYSPDTHSKFAQAIAASYHESLDCPALNGMRDTEDVIAGHKASGEFDPRFWFVLLERDEPRGVALLARVVRSDAAELVYLGLSPALRGRGVADLLMRQALWSVHQMGLRSLTLAVDSLNAPALKLYYRYGMERVGAKIAMMRNLRER